MASVNSVHLLGYVGHTPQLAVTRTGVKTARVSLATSRTIYRQDGTKLEETEWHRVVVFDRLAEIICQYVQKGNLLWVEGRLRTRSYKGRDGTDKTVTEIIAESVQFMRSQQEI